MICEKKKLCIKKNGNIFLYFNREYFRNKGQKNQKYLHKEQFFVHIS